MPPKYCLKKAACISGGYGVRIGLVYHKLWEDVKEGSAMSQLKLRVQGCIVLPREV